MNILTEIIEVSHEIVDTLKEENFFDESQFIDEESLTIGLQTAMQYKWEQQNQMFLTEDEFLEVCREITGNFINKALNQLVESGHVQTFVNPDGELCYSATDKPYEI